jgi:hypothetical protein
MHDNETQDASRAPKLPTDILAPELAFDFGWLACLMRLLAGVDPELWHYEKSVNILFFI